MNLRVLLCCTLVCFPGLVAGQGQTAPAPAVAAAAASEIPHLRKQGTATQLIVDGKPFLALAGELSNSSATGIEYMKLVWSRLAMQKGLNTVLAGVSWNQIEPREGKFDFAVLDSVIQGARAHNMRLVLLWFGTWKNGLSSYMPDWVKRDFERFPRAQIVGDDTPWPVWGVTRGKFTGSMNIELLSPFGDATRDADASAFAALMRHVKAVDGHERTVIMIQVENEVGLQGDTRDRSPAANKAFDGPVPLELIDYIDKHKDTLIPEFRKVWEAAGFKTSGTWEEPADGRNLHGLALCALRRPGNRGGESRVPAAHVRELPADRIRQDARATQRKRTERRPYARRDGRLEGRGAANRFSRGRHLQQRLHWVCLPIQSIRQSALHPRVQG